MTTPRTSTSTDTTSRTTTTHDHDDHEGHDHSGHRARRLSDRRRDVPRRQGRVLPGGPRQPDPGRGARGVPGTPLLRRRRIAPVRRAAAGAVRRQRARQLPDPDVGRQASRGRASGNLRVRARGRDAASHRLHDSPRARTSRSSCRSSTRPAARRRTAPAGTSTSTRRRDGTYVVDFNLAYHPSCVYDPRFSCPLTPAENRLPVRIEAGERLAADHA